MKEGKAIKATKYLFYFIHEHFEVEYNILTVWLVWYATHMEFYYQHYSPDQAQTTIFRRVFLRDVEQNFFIFLISRIIPKNTG